jgi:carbonic anhydrase
MKKAVLFLLLLVVYAHALIASEDVHWGYEGAEGPQHWAELSDEYHLCAEGVNQSPVDLVSNLDITLPELVFQYHGSPLNEVHSGHTIQVNVQPGNFLEIEEIGESYQLIQAHFHSPSEHAVDGRLFDMEIHLVHADDAGALAVVGILIEEGDEHPALNRIWSFMPEKEGESTSSPLSVFEAGVLPPTRQYFSYSGSLTTPPCSEGVRWVVLQDHFTVSPAQISRFRERVGEWSNRPVQPRNARWILE